LAPRFVFELVVMDHCSSSYCFGSTILW